MKRVFFVLIVAVILLVAAVGAASAHGNTPAHLGNAGWTCMNVPNLGVHCFPPSIDFTTLADNPPASIPVKVFHTNDPTSDDAEFLGTEILIRYDIYERGNHDAPCPQEEAEHYFDLRTAPDPLPYYACHHYSHDH